MNTYTDTQLKQCLAKMLPEFHFDSSMLYWPRNKHPDNSDGYSINGGGFMVVLDTELLHLCWMVEEPLNKQEYGDYMDTLADMLITKEVQFPRLVHATWQQRVIALAKVKGIEIV